MRKPSLVLSLLLLGCPSEQAPTPFPTGQPGMPTAFPGMTAAAAVPFPQTAVGPTAAPVAATAAPEPEETTPAVAMAEGMTEAGWRSIADASAEGATLLATAALSDSVAAIFRSEGTAFFVHVEDRRARAVWLDVDVAWFALFAERRGEVAVAYRRRSENRDLFVQRIDLRRVTRKWVDPGTPGGARLATRCAAGLGAACVQWASREDVLVASSCGEAGSTYAVLDEDGNAGDGGPLPSPPACGTEIGGRGALGGAIWGSFGYAGGRATFRSAENGEVQVKAENDHVILQRPGSSEEPPRAISLARVLSRAAEDARNDLARRAPEFEAAVRASIAQEFASDARLLAVALEGLEPAQGADLLRRQLAGSQRPTDDDLREYLCGRESLAAAVGTALATGVTLPCEAAPGSALAEAVEAARTAAPAAATAAPETAAPETAAPETAAPETAAPETAAPATAAPETAAPATAAPETAAPVETPTKAELRQRFLQKIKAQREGSGQ